jgi:hypothetical protein
MGQSLFSLFRPAYQNAPELANLVSEARLQSTSADVLKQQVEFDDKISRELALLKMNDAQAVTLKNLLSQAALAAAKSPSGTADPGKTSRTSAQSPATSQSKDEDLEEGPDGEEKIARARPRTILFAVGVGLVATVCMVIFLISDRMNTFEGADRIGELLNVANNLTGDEFDPVETKAGDLQDWFFLKHGLEHYAVPKQFANIKTVGCRVFKFDGVTVAQIMAVTDKEILLYMFPSNELGIKIRKGKWQIVEDENWVGGVTGINETCFMVAFKGKKDDMKDFLAKTLH